MRTFPNFVLLSLYLRLDISQNLTVLVTAGASRWLDGILPLLGGCSIRYLQTTSHPQVKGE
jgi:hypothetical protein